MTSEANRLEVFQDVLLHGPVPRRPLIAGEDVGGQVGADDLPEMERPIRIRPRDADENVFGHWNSVSG